MSKHKTLPYEALFFSPHLDDVVLSCGGLIARLVHQKKRVLVITLFTTSQELANKSQDLVNFVKQSKTKNSTALFTDRRKEDQKALRHLGADFLHLPFIDALWRTADNNQLYPGFKQIFAGRIASHDNQLLIDIEIKCLDIINNYANKHSATLYAPLAIGRHVDHVLTYTVIRRLEQKLKIKVTYWEDVPYRNQLTNREKRFATLELVPKYETISLSSNEVRQKKRACNFYSSQINRLKKTDLGTLDYYKEGFFQL